MSDPQGPRTETPQQVIEGLLHECREFLRKCHLPNGALVCRWCQRSSHQGHDEECYFVAFSEERERIAAKLDAALAHLTRAEPDNDALRAGIADCLAGIEEFRTHATERIHARQPVEISGRQQRAIDDAIRYLRSYEAQLTRAEARETPTCQTDETLLKALKLLEALQEPCNDPSDGEDHAWRLCRRCLAIRQFDFSPDVTRILVGRVLDVVRSVVPSVQEPRP